MYTGIKIRSLKSDLQLHHKRTYYIKSMFQQTWLNFSEPLDRPGHRAQTSTDSLTSSDSHCLGYRAAGLASPPEGQGQTEGSSVCGQPNQPVAAAILAR